MSRPSRARRAETVHLIGTIGLLALAYAAAGWLGLLLAVPPGYATVVWPASGIALAALLLVSRRVWPGILLGSFVINAYNGGVFESFAAAPAVVAAAIAAGSTVQALLAERLIRRRFGDPIALGGFADVGRFALLSGPVACLVAATFGVTALHLAGFVTPAKILPNWLTWWVGDMAGILIVLPVMLLGPWSIRAMTWRGHVVPRFNATMVIGLVILIGATLAAWKITTVTTYERNLATFQNLTTDNEQALRNRLNSYRQSLDGGAALFEASREVSLEEWQDYVAVLDLENTLPGISGIGYIKPVERDNIAGFQDYLRQRGVDDLTIHPDSGQPELFVITYIEPAPRNHQAIGLDIAFEENRRQAAIWSRDTGRATITRRIELVQDSTRSWGFLLLRPLYDHHMPLDSVSNRRAAFRGWIYSPFIAPKFMSDLTASQANSFDISIYDGRAADPDDLIYTSADPAEEGHEPIFTVTRTFPVMQQYWTVTWKSSRAFEKSVGGKEPLLVLAGGAALTLCFAFLLLSYSRREAYVHREVARKTRDLKIALDALRESEGRFSDLAGLSPAGIFSADSYGFLTYVNHAWTRATGLPASQSMGAGWVEAVHPDDRKRVRQEWLAAVGASERFRAQFRFLHGDGNQIWIDIICAPQKDAAGEVSGYIGVAIDITGQRQAAEALRESERRFQALAAFAPAGILRADREGRLTYVNAAWSRMSGLSLAEVEEKGLADSTHPDDLERIEKIWFDSITNGTPHRVEFRWVHEDGTTIWVDTLVQPEYNDDDEVIGYIGVMLDVTERKEMERELVEARANAEAGAAAKSAFLANMSHEIRTPMNGVIGFTELLLGDDLTPEQRRHAQLIADSGRAMMRLLNDILDMSKIESGQMHLAEEPVDLRHKINSCVRLMEPTAREKGVDISFSVDPEIPARLAGDPHRLRQILLNLIGNAVKFTEEGTIKVSASIVRDSVAEPRLRVDIADTGIGIAADRLDMIFQQFAQADSSTARKYGGTGLGLAISSELAKLMNGSLSVTSAQGKGTTFSLTLPLIPHIGAIETAPEPETIIESVPADAVNPRVLIAEDNDINQLLIMSMAERANFDAEISPDGEDAVRRVLEAEKDGRPYDMVLMDVQMPLVDGLEATRQLRAAGIDADRLPIIALTANAFAEDIEACLAAGMQAHLSKPVKLADLRALAVRFAGRAASATQTQAAEPTSAPRPAEDAAAKPPEPKPAAGKPSLKDRYVERREETFEAMRDLVARGEVGDEDLARLIDLLHKLAGTAGFFDQAGLGKKASEVEKSLRSKAGDPHQVIARGLEELEAA